jgi:hypothetical protein
VNPQSEKVNLGNNEFTRGTADTLENLGHVTQVESVVRLDWDRSEFLFYTVVHDLGSIDNVLDIGPHIIREDTEVSGYDLTENHLNGVVVKR